MQSPNGGGARSDNSTYLEPLKAGDLVLVYQLSDSKFVVIDKVVNP